MSSRGLVQKHRAAMGGMRSVCERGEREESRVRQQMVRLQARLRLEETDYEKQCGGKEGRDIMLFTENTVCRWSTNTTWQLLIMQHFFFFTSSLLKVRSFVFEEA